MENLIYERVMRLINEKHFTKAKVEGMAGLGNGAIESLKNGNPTIKTLKAVSSVLNCTIEDLIKEGD